MSKPSISIRLAPKTKAGHGGQMKHDLRRSPIPEYVDQKRIDQNSTVLTPKPSAELWNICVKRREQRKMKRKLRSDARVAFEGIITFSHSAQPIFESLNIFEQDRRFKEIAENIAKELNTTLEGLVVHRDESAIHAHFTLAGFDKNGKPLTETVKRPQCRNIQDVAAEVVRDLGINRGKSKIERIADGEPLEAYINRSVRQLHNDLPAEIESLQSQIEQLNKELATATERAEKAARNLERTEKKLEEAGEENERLQKRLKTYHKRIENAENERKKLEDTKTTLEAEIERLKRLVEPQKPKAHQIQFVKGWEETGWWPLKHQEPIIGIATVVKASEAEAALLSAKKAEEAAKEKAKKAKEEANALREQLETATELFDAYTQNQPSKQPSPQQPELSSPTPIIIEKYNVVLANFETKVTVLQEGTPKQTAAALYSTPILIDGEMMRGIGHYTVTSEIAEEIIKLAKEDGILKSISFEDGKQQQMLEAEINAQKEIEAITNAIRGDREEETAPTQSL